MEKTLGAFVAKGGRSVVLGWIAIILLFVLIFVLLFLLISLQEISLLQEWLLQNGTHFTFAPSPEEDRQKATIVILMVIALLSAGTLMLFFNVQRFHQCELYEYGVRIKRGKEFQDIFYENIPYTKIGFVKLVIPVLGMKISQEDEKWTIIVGDIVDSVFPLYEKLRTAKSEEILNADGKVPFLRAKATFFEEYFGSSYGAILPNKHLYFAIGTKNSQFGDIEYKNEELSWEMNKEGFTVSKGTTLIFEAQFEDITNPNICYSILREIKPITV